MMRRQGGPRRYWLEEEDPRDHDGYDGYIRAGHLEDVDEEDDPHGGELRPVEGLARVDQVLEQEAARREDCRGGPMASEAGRQFQVCRESNIR